MTLPVSRRNLLRAGTLGGLGIAIAGSVEAIAGPASAHAPAAGYGALVPDPAGLLALPPGFSYKIVAKAGETLLETGQPTPGDPDGTGFFRHGNGWTLVNNHEIGGSEEFGVPALLGLVYDQGVRGGTTNIEVDRHGNRIREYVSVAGTHNKVRWVDVPDRQGLALSVRKQFTDDQVTRSRKFEGSWWGDGGIYVVASFARLSDGSAKEHDGQVWFYDPHRGTLTLKTIFGVNPDPGAEGNFDGPDNITVSPFGGVILAEDGEGLSHLVGVDVRGNAFALARNEFNDSEFAGTTFSEDGRILFANIYSPGWVFAIAGPWGRAC
jgi:secreted PhoX family phosphatase